MSMQVHKGPWSLRNTTFRNSVLDLPLNLNVVYYLSIILERPEIVCLHMFDTKLMFCLI